MNQAVVIITIHDNDEGEVDLRLESYPSINLKEVEWEDLTDAQRLAFEMLRAAAEQNEVKER